MALFRMRGLAHRDVGTVLVVLIVVYSPWAQALEQCSICDSQGQIDTCLTDYPHRRFDLCPVDGRYAMLHDHEWHCKHDKSDNAHQLELWQTMELRPVNGATAANILRNRSFAGIDLIAAPNRHAKMDNACWSGEGAEGPHGCYAFHMHKSDCALGCTKHDDNCHMVDNLPGPSACLLYTGLGEGTTILRVKWMEPMAKMCHLHYNSHEGWMHKIPSPFPDVQDLEGFFMMAVSPYSKRETWKKLHSQCDRLFHFLHRAMFASYPYEKHKHPKKQHHHNPFTRNNVESEQANMVRYELYRYGKYDYSQAMAFASFTPESNQHTAQVFEKQFGHDLMREASHCYAISNIKFIALVGKDSVAEDPDALRLVTTTLDRWPHIDVEIRERPKDRCTVRALFSSWSHCFGDADLLRPVVHAPAREAKEPWLGPARSINDMILQMNFRQNKGGSLSGLKEGRAMEHIFKSQKGALLDATEEADAFINPFIALIFGMVLLVAAIVFYRLWVHLWPLLDPLVHPRKPQPPRFIPRMFKDDKDFILPSQRL